MSKLLELDALSSQEGSFQKDLVQEEWSAKKSLLDLLEGNNGTETKTESNQQNMEETRPPSNESSNLLASQLAAELENQSTKLMEEGKISLQDITSQIITSDQSKNSNDELLTSQEKEELADVPLSPAQLIIRSNRDVAEILIDVIHEVFYNPKTGFWKSYDQQFRVNDFIKYGKPGWNSAEDIPARLAARDEINRRKNEELDRLMKTDFCVNSIDIVLQTMESIIQGVKRRDVKKAIRLHCRDHLSLLVYGEKK